MRVLIRKCDRFLFIVCKQRPENFCLSGQLHIYGDNGQHTQRTFAFHYQKNLLPIGKRFIIESTDSFSQVQPITRGLGPGSRTGNRQVS